MTTTTAPVDRTLQVLLDEAVGVTRAATGLLLRVGAEGLVVVATSGPVPAGTGVGAVVAATGPRGFALSAGQPTALVPSAADASAAGIGGGTGVPASLLVAPAGEVGALELADTTRGAFTFDDIETASAFATVAAAGMEASGTLRRPAVPPARLGAELTALAGQDPDRYGDVARLVEALLATGR